MATDSVAENLLARHLAQHDGGDGAALAVEADRLLKINIDQSVAAQHGERVVEEAGEVLDSLHAAGRADGLSLHLPALEQSFEGVGDLHSELGAVSKVVLDYGRQMAACSRRSDRSLSREAARGSIP